MNAIYQTKASSPAQSGFKSGKRIVTVTDENGMKRVKIEAQRVEGNYSFATLSCELVPVEVFEKFIFPGLEPA